VSTSIRSIRRKSLESHTFANDLIALAFWRNNPATRIEFSIVLILARLSLSDVTPTRLSNLL
ncbi:MAG TPA: hypothetical protein VEH56_06560, partial [Candidatus Saccharimonadales bacterium]|nr:hypothetical protein [Candidatus Saccharimonadales bacterium]